MIHNKRTMGEAAGVWFGPEVERTQFYGLPTIFYSRFLALRDKQELIGNLPHVFIAVVNPKFYDGLNVLGVRSTDAYLKMCEIISSLLESGKRVTVEVGSYMSTHFLKFRTGYPSTFCLLIVVEVPKVEIGGFAVKAAPTNVFTSQPHEGCVMTASFENMKAGASRWAEYDVDREVKQ